MNLLNLISSKLDTNYQIKTKKTVRQPAGGHSAKSKIFPSTPTCTSNSWIAHKLTEGVGALLLQAMFG